MGLFVWSPDYSVRIASLDGEHQRLIAMINEVHEDLTKGRPAEHVGAILDRLIGYTMEHFAHEELLFAKHHYPEVEPHIQEHRRLVQQVVDFKHRYLANEPMLGMEIFRFLKNWLITHILNTDKRYTNHLQQAGVH